jgi:hypothetical protein
MSGHPCFASLAGLPDRSTRQRGCLQIFWQHLDIVGGADAIKPNTDQVLVEISEIIGRSAAKRALRRLRRIAVVCLSISRFLNPSKFEEWNRRRIDQQGSAAE